MRKSNWISLPGVKLKMFELPPPIVYICDMDISCCLPTLAFHTPMLARLSFCRVHSSNMGANHVDSRKCWFTVWVDSFLHLDSQLTNIHLLAESFWRIITNPVVVRTTQCVRELVVSMALCAVFSIFFLNGSFRVSTCDNKLPKSLVGILTQAHEKTQGETLRTECKKKTWKPCWGSKSTLELRQSLHQNPKTLGRASLAISSVLSTSTLVKTQKSQKHLPFVCGAGYFIKSWLQLPKFLLFTFLETTCPKSAWPKKLKQKP